MSRKKRFIFTDFDGSFCEKDIGHRIFRHFSDGKNSALVEEWKKGRISSRQCMLKEAELINATEEEVLSFVGQFRLSPGATELYAYAFREGIPFYIVSDGSDIYIKEILRKYNLSGIPFFSNRVRIKGGRYIIEFPRNNNGCTRCGSCKGARIAEIVGLDRSKSEVVFIGDGLSDLCALPQADIIFARGDLLDYCRVNKIPAFAYKDFYDILKHIKNQIDSPE